KSKIRVRCWMVNASAIMNKASGRASVMAAKAWSKSATSCTPRGCTVRPNARAAASIWVKLRVMAASRVFQRTATREGGKRLFEQLQPLPTDVDGQARDAREVAPRMGKGGHEARAQETPRAHRHERDCAGRGFQGLSRRVARRHDQVELEPDQLVHKGSQV